MPKQNPYFITENYKKTEEIRMIESDFDKSQPIRQLEEKEQLAEQQKIEASYYEEFESYNDLGVKKSYGPGNNQSSESPAIRRKEVEIIGKEIHSGRQLKDGKIISFIKLYLSEKVVYEDGSYNHIYFVDCLPFRNYQIGEILKIDIDKVARKSNLHNFDDRNIATREYWSPERKRKMEKLAIKGTLGAVSMGLNEICPTLGELTTDVGQAAGSVMEMAGNLTENENLEKAGEVINSGFAMGSSLNNTRNIFKDKGKIKDHIDECFRCDEKGSYNKNAKRIIAGANSLMAGKEVLEPFVKK